MKHSLMKTTAIAMIMAVILCGCTKKTEDDTQIQVENTEEAMSQYTLAQVKKGTVSSEVKVNCQYSPKEKLTCAFTGESKIIKEVLVEKGDIVTKGQVLARLDIESLDEKIKDEQHKLEMAQLELTHLNELKKIDLDLLTQEYNYVDKELRDSATYNQNKKQITKTYDNKITDCSDQITIHQMRMQEYQTEAEAGTLRAPADGVIVLSRSNLIGEYSKPDENVITMIRNDDLTFISNEMESAQYFKEGTTYQVVTGKGETTSAIDVIPSDMSQWTEQMYFEIQVPNLKMESGTKGTIWIKLDEKDNVLYVPNGALHQSGDKYYVYTVSEEGFRNIQYVTPGITGRENTEIKDGLTLGQYVITE